MYNEAYLLKKSIKNLEKALDNWDYYDKDGKIAIDPEDLRLLLKQYKKYEKYIRENL